MGVKSRLCVLRAHKQTQPLHSTNFNLWRHSKLQCSILPFIIQFDIKCIEIQGKEKHKAITGSHYLVKGMPR